MAKVLQSQLILSLVDRVTAPARGIQAQMDRLNARTKAANDEANRIGGKLAVASAQMAGFALAVSQPIRAAMDLEDKMADIGKVSDMNADELKAFEGSLRHLARTEIPMAVEELAALAESAAASGIADQDLEKFTRQVAKSAVAWGVSGDYAGESLAKIKSALGMTIDETARYADAVNFLADTSASEAPDLIEFARRVAADGKIAGFTNEQVLALGSSMIAMGAQSDVAATSLRNAQKALTRGPSATKRQDAAFRKLGLHADDVAKAMPTDAMGQFLGVLERINALDQHERIATMSDLFGDEARALMPLLSELDKVRETTAAVADETNYLGSVQKEFTIRSKTGRYALQRFRNQLRDVGITVGQSLLPGMKEILDRLAPIILAVGKWTEENGKLTAKIIAVTGAVMGLRVALLALRFAGLTGKAGVLNLLAGGMNTVGRAGFAVYDAVASVAALRRSLQALEARRATDVFGSIAVGLQKVSNPAKLSGMERLSALLRGLAGVTGLTAVAKGIGAIGVVMATISAPVWIAAAAAVTAVGLAWQFWDRISAIVSGVASAIGERLRPEMERIREWMKPLEPVLKWFGETWDTIASAVGKAVEAVKGFAGSLFSREILTDGEVADISARAAQITTNIIAKLDAITAAVYETAGRLLTLGGEMIQSLWDGMKAKLPELIEWAKSIPDQLEAAIGGTWMGILSGGRSGQPDLGTYNPATGAFEQAKAMGGHMRARVPTLVGERGPEAIYPSRAGWVAHANKVKALSEMSRRIRPAPMPRPVQSGGGSRPVNVTFGNIVVQGGANASARDISREIGREVQAELRGTFTDPY
ncbi:phage tail tape measure protein [Paracoccus sp. 22332]|uniref:phage tail tape measure protein n=1 Tax=Paracoccus sp. 22332 TaxID=3453913 RepID=UPI003F878620